MASAPSAEARSQGSNNPVDLKIKSLKTEVTCTVELQLENVSGLLSPYPVPEGQPVWNSTSNSFGPGFTLLVERVEKKDFGVGVNIAVYVLLAKGLPSMTVTCTAVFNSPKGHHYSSTVPHVLRLAYGKKIGFLTPTSRFTTGHGLKYTTNNSLTCKVTIQYTEPEQQSNALPATSLDLLHSTISPSVDPQILEIANVRLFAYSRRSTNVSAVLSRCRELRVASAALAKAGECSWARILRRGTDKSLWKTLDKLPVSPMSTEWSDSDSDMSGIDDEARSSYRLESEPSIKRDPNAEEAYNKNDINLLVVGTSARTLEAVLYWAMTGWIVFKPLTSRGQDRKQTFMDIYRRDGSSKRPSPPSCKSVYRVATILGLNTLKQCALQHLESELTTDNILTELFSHFTNEYDEVKAIEILSVVKSWDTLKSSDQMQTKMTEVANGKFPHAGKVMADLWARVSAVKDVGGHEGSGDNNIWFKNSW